MTFLLHIEPKCLDAEKNNKQNFPGGNANFKPPTRFVIDPLCREWIASNGHNNKAILTQAVKNVYSPNTFRLHT